MFVHFCNGVCIYVLFLGKRFMNSFEVHEIIITSALHININNTNKQSLRRTVVGSWKHRSRAFPLKKALLMYVHECVYDLETDRNCIIHFRPKTKLAPKLTFWLCRKRKRNCIASFGRKRKRKRNN